MNGSESGIMGRRKETVTIQQVCALAVLTVRKPGHASTKIPSPKAILNGFLHVTMKVLNSYKKLMKFEVRRFSGNHRMGRFHRSLVFPEPERRNIKCL